MAVENMLKKNFRVPSDLWASAMEAAAENDQTISDVLRTALEAYTTKPCDSCGECDICGGEILALEPPRRRRPNGHNHGLRVVR